MILLETVVMMRTLFDLKKIFLEQNVLYNHQKIDETNQDIILRRICNELNLIKIYFLKIFGMLYKFHE